MAKDFRNKQFGRIIRGYNPDEVDEYIGYINDEYRKLERRCADSERKLALALKKLDEMHQKNASAGDAGKELAAAAVESAKADAARILEAADARAAEITEAAERTAADKARVILEEAAKGAEEILAGAENDAAENKETARSLFATAEKMYGEVCAFRDSLFDIYNSHIESIEQMTREADRAMGVIGDEFEEAVPDTEEETAEDPEIEVEIEVLEDESADSGEQEAISEDDGEPVADLYIDLEESLEEENSLDSLFYLEEDEEKADDAEENFQLTADEEDAESEDYGESDLVEYEDTDDDAFLVDWSSRSAEDDEEFDEDSDETDAEEIAEEPAEALAFADLDDMFSESESGEMSLTEEFDLVFNAANAKKNVEQIRKQPTITPEKPKNPKKHQKF